jgi:hypothetical protein
MAYRDVNVLPEAQFSTYEGLDAAEPGSTIWGLLLVKLGNDGRLDDHFTRRVAGSQRITAKFGAEQITTATGTSQFPFVLERRPADLVFKANSFCSKWEDLDALVAANKAMVVTSDADDADQAFREAWTRAKEADENLGAAVRWSVQAHPVYGMKLVLQGMPSPARALRRYARLSAGRASAIELGAWTISARMGKDAQLHGPVPVLFASDFETAPANMKKHHYRFVAGV